LYDPPVGGAFLKFSGTFRAAPASRLHKETLLKQLFCLFTAAALALAAADVTGVWSGDFEMTRNGETRPDRVHMQLKQDGTSVTGTAGPGEDRQWQISNAKLSGDKLTFDVVIPDGGVMKFDLTVEADRMKGSALGERGEERMTVKVDVKRHK
jgi:hypothetical protein